MAEIVGVRFKDLNKIYYYSTNKQKISVNDIILAETSRGLEIGTVILKSNKALNDKLLKSTKKIIRKADRKDLERLKKLEIKERKAEKLFNEKVKKYHLEVKLIKAKYTFDCGKILFYFTANNRVDFRFLVKDLAKIFKMRIELRQVSARDEVRFLGGLGPCGRPVCCATFLIDPQPMSIKMAKDQDLSLNSTKISGICGRLMCCLRYEQEVYKELSENAPQIGDVVKTPKGCGVVIDRNLIMNSFKIKIEGNEIFSETFALKDIEIMDNRH